MPNPSPILAALQNLVDAHRLVVHNEATHVPASLLAAAEFAIAGAGALPNIDDTLEALLSRLAGDEFPCTRIEDRKACLQQHEGLDGKGRTKFYFATDCKLAVKLCQACAAYWHVAVARNNLIEVARWKRQLDAEIAQSNATPLPSADVRAAATIRAQMGES